MISYDGENLVLKGGYEDARYLRDVLFVCFSDVYQLVHL